MTFTNRDRMVLNSLRRLDDADFACDAHRARIAELEALQAADNYWNRLEVAGRHINQHGWLPNALRVRRGADTVPA